MQERGKPINVILGEKDGLINNEAVEKLFKDNFPDVPITITTNPRGHAATIEEILTPIHVVLPKRTSYRGLIFF